MFSMMVVFLGSLLGVTLLTLILIIAAEYVRDWLHRRAVSRAGTERTAEQSGRHSTEYLFGDRWEP